MDERIQAALQTDRTIDITTTGRRSGEPRRIEIWFHNIEGRIYITGMPGKRSWYANLLADENFMFHLKESTRTDLPATARAVTEEHERRHVLQTITHRVGQAARLDAWVANSPLVEVSFP